MRFKNYDRPDGWAAGQPEVLVAEKVVEKLGFPEVNYGSLEQYFVDDFGIADGKVTIKLDNSGKVGSNGGHQKVFTRTIHVKPIRAEQYGKGTMSYVSHEARH